MVRTVLVEKPNAGSFRFDGNEGSSARPRRSSLFDCTLLKSICVLGLSLMLAGVTVAGTASYSDDGTTLFVEGEAEVNALNLVNNALTIAPAENAETAKLTFTGSMDWGWKGKYTRYTVVVDPGASLEFRNGLRNWNGSWGSYPTFTARLGGTIDFGPRLELYRGDVWFRGPGTFRVGECYHQWQWSRLADNAKLVLTGSRFVFNPWTNKGDNYIRLDGDPRCATIKPAAQDVSVVVNSEPYILLNNGTLTFDSEGADDGLPHVLTIDKPNGLTGAGTVRKIGSGTLRYTQPQNYTGTTSVEGGALEIPSTIVHLSSSIVVDANGELKMIAPNAEVGTVTLDGTLTVAGEGTVKAADLTLGAKGRIVLFVPATGGANLTVPTMYVQNGGKIAVEINGALPDGDYVLVDGAPSAVPTLEQVGKGWNAMTTALVIENGKLLLRVTNSAASIAALAWRGEAGDAWTTGLWALGPDYLTTQLWAESSDVLFDGVGGNSVTVDADVSVRSMTLAEGDLTLGGMGTIAGSEPLVKRGTGTLTLDGVNLANQEVIVEQGTLKLGENAGAMSLGAATAEGAGGAVTIKAGAQFDLNYNAADNNGVRAAITKGKKFFIEGDGPDGNGALVSTGSSTTWSASFNEIVLTGDATIGGPNRIDLRGNASNSITAATNATLTVKATATTGLNVHGLTKVDKVVVAEGATFCSEGANAVFELDHGLDLYGNLYNWGATVNWRGPEGVKVGSTTASIIAASGSSNLYYPITVPTGSALALKGGATDYYRNAITNDGAIVQSAGTHVMMNEYTGSGSWTVTGGTLALDGGATAPEGATPHFNVTGGLVQLGTYGTNGEPFKTTGYSVDFNNSGAGLRLTTGAAVAYDLSGIVNGSGGVYFDTNSRANPFKVTNLKWAVIGGARFVLSEDDTSYGAPVTLGAGCDIATDNLSFPRATSSAYTSLLLTDGAKMSPRIIDLGSYNSMSPASLIVDNGSLTAADRMLVGWEAKHTHFQLHAGEATVKDMFIAYGWKGGAGYHNRFTQDAGSLTISNGGFKGNPYGQAGVVLEGGSLTLAGDSSNRTMMPIVFGERAGKSYTVDIEDHSVTWNTGLAGESAVTLNGSGTFTSGYQGNALQGIPRAKWTITNTGTNDLSGAAGFADGLELAENVQATVNMSGKSLVRAFCMTSASIDQSVAISPAGRLTFYAPSDLKLLHTYYGTEIVPKGTIQYRGSFYVEEEATYTFAGGYDDSLRLAIDGAQVLRTTSAGQLAAGSVALTEGWHTFRIDACQTGGASGPVSGPWRDNNMALGWMKGESTSTDVAGYTRFDGEHFEMKPDAGTFRIRRSWRSGLNDNWATNELWDEIILTDNITDVNVNKPASETQQNYATTRFDGWFYVKDTQVGSWYFWKCYNGQMDMTIDGTRIGFNGTGNQIYATKITLAEGWHRFETRFYNTSTSNWGAAPYGNHYNYGGLSVEIKGNGSWLQFFNPNNFQFRADDPANDSLVPGLAGVTTLGAGSVLANTAADGVCPITGTLAGAGTLSGAFAFAGDANEWRVSGSGAESMLEGVVKFENVPADALAELKKITVKFEGVDTRGFYKLGTAPGAVVSKIALEVRNAEDVPQVGWKLVQKSDGLRIVNSFREGTIILVR